MNIIDIVFLVLVGLGAFVGAMRGVLREFLSLVHIFAAAASSLALSDYTLKLVLKLYELPADGSRQLVPWLCGFLLIYLFILGLLALARPVFRSLRMRGDRLAGALLGIVRTASLLALLFPLLLWATPSGGRIENAFTGSRVLTGARKSADTTFAGFLVPPSWVEYLDDAAERHR